jgi:hypothetical protein
MRTIKNSLVGFVVLSLLIIGLATLLPRATSGQGDSQNAPPHRTARKFYITQTLHDGDDVLSACADGYHTASLWEIFDVSNLRYDTQIGLTAPDSGFGPPTNFAGWIRTGIVPSPGPEPGFANCFLWTRATPDILGTRVFLPADWDSTGATLIHPWVASATSCHQPSQVWCVQD